MGRAQSSVEFMILVGFVLMFFVAFLFTLAIASSERLAERQRLAIQQIAQTVQEEVAFAHSTVDGYQRTFVLPLHIVNLEYELEVIDLLLYVHTVDGEQALVVSIKNVTGTFTPGSNTLRRFNNTVYANS